MAGDDVDEFRAALEPHAGDADLIITTGGVSAGAYEVVKDALRAGEVEFVKVAMQPGMPQGAGSGDGTPIITLPAIRSARWCRSRCSSARRCARRWGCRTRSARGARPMLTEDLTSPRGKRQFRRGVLDADEGTVTSYGPPASHHLRWLASANCLLEIAEDVTEMRRGIGRAGVGPVVAG